jgi:60S ribosome subunit biogenesis protein NIP7
VQYKVWVKPAAEMSFLYGHNITKAGLGRITEDTPQYQGVVVYSMADVPLGMEALRVSHNLARARLVYLERSEH